jgi:pimeloyl-ACP methyl ester carboxylesterase
MRETHFVTVAGDERVAVDLTTPAKPSGKRVAVFVHGFVSNRQGEKALFFAERFEAMGWHFLSLDMRGHGDSSGGIESLTLSNCIADLAAALAWLPQELGPPVLIGSSMGGAVSAWYHLLNPERVGALALIAPSFSFPTHLNMELGAEELRSWQETRTRRFANEWLDVQVGFGLMEDARKYDPQKLVEGYAAPTLIFHGMQDDAVPWQASMRFMQECPCPTLDLVLIKDGDHRLTDYKEYMFATMAAWLERTPSSE